MVTRLHLYGKWVKKCNHVEARAFVLGPQIFFRLEPLNSPGRPERDHKINISQKIRSSLFEADYTKIIGFLVAGRQRTQVRLLMGMSGVSLVRRTGNSNLRIVLG
ncbi:hypothetical protein RchiOBHm_Chr5g0029071 [Rosa chinensis]|uniref:Uncharacterized protein n=1 Tax=Rosa chinensis TaxID=74649 RepID=A0A2P6Q9I4_ROSCH|nr:hypothetical protein RchiOBHm_Chr5g0029071 [Rosa chinensis]